MVTEWKTIRITKEAWREAKKKVAGEDVDLDDFLSFIIESTDLDLALEDYLKALEEEDDEEDEDEDDGEEEEAPIKDVVYDPKKAGKTQHVKGGLY